MTDDLLSPAGIWPTTVAGWMALFLGLSAVVAVIYGYAKGIAHLNGLGDRTKKLELASERLEADNINTKATVRDHEAEMRRTREDVSRVMAWMERSHTELHEMKEELIGFVSERLSKIDTAVHDLDKRVAIVQRDIEQFARDQERRDGR